MPGEGQDRGPGGSSVAVVGKFPTQHWELEAEEHQEMMLNVLGGFYKKTNKLKDVPEKKCFATTCNVVRLESTFAPNGLHSANPPCTTECPRCHRSTPGSSQAPPPAAPCFSAGCYGWDHACIQDSGPSRRLIWDFLEITILPAGLGLLFSEEAILCAAKRWQGQAMGCHITVLGHYRCSLRCADSLLCPKPMPFGMVNSSEIVYLPITQLIKF